MSFADKAKGMGANIYSVAINDNLDFMFSRSIADPDGHVLEAFWMDMEELGK